MTYFFAIQTIYYCSFVTIENNFPFYFIIYCPISSPQGNIAVFHLSAQSVRLCMRITREYVYIYVLLTQVFFQLYTFIHSDFLLSSSNSCFFHFLGKSSLAFMLSSLSSKEMTPMSMTIYRIEHERLYRPCIGYKTKKRRTIKTRRHNGEVKRGLYRQKKQEHTYIIVFNISF